MLENVFRVFFVKLTNVKAANVKKYISTVDLNSEKEILFYLQSLSHLFAGFSMQRTYSVRILQITKKVDWN